VDTNARHAGDEITYSGTLPANTAVANVTVESPIDLRLDVFGDKQGLLFSHNSNSLAEGVPEPSAFLLFGVGLLGLLAARPRNTRRR
jgi:hypothetical protein